MIMFLVGFICCWIIIGAVCFICDTLDWGVCFLNTVVGVFICLPVIIIAFPFYEIYCFIIRPWRNVWTPVAPKRFDEVMSWGHSKAWKILPNVYLCFEAKAKWINKVFFVRVKK